MKRKKLLMVILSMVLVFVVATILLLPKEQNKNDNHHDYGVFLSMTHDDPWKKKLKHYNTVVIDAQSFSKKDISWLKQHNGRVLTYINVGSIENFRPYYQRYKDITIKPYEHWEEERWVNVNEPRWQQFMKETLIPQLLNKGIDGFFVDNLDIYDLMPTKETFQSLTTLLAILHDNHRPVLINGADTFVSYCMKHDAKKLHQWFSGVNQETVLTAIDFDHNKLKKQTSSEFNFYHNYLKYVASHHLQVYLLEYTTSSTLTNNIQSYCQKHHYHYYISNSIELD